MTPLRVPSLPDNFFFFDNLICAISNSLAQSRPVAYTHTNPKLLNMYIKH